MKRKNVVLLIIIAIVLIAFTVYSIVREDLTTVQEIIGKTIQTASTEVVEEKNEDDGFIELSSQTELSENQGEEKTTVENPEEDDETIAALNTEPVNPIEQIVENSTENNNTVDNTVKKDTESNTIEEQNISIATINSLNVGNSVGNTNGISLTNTLVNQERLPAAGEKTFIIWTLIILAIISVISNIQYNNIKLK